MTHMNEHTQYRAVPSGQRLRINVVFSIGATARAPEKILAKPGFPPISEPCIEGRVAVISNNVEVSPAAEKTAWAEFLADCDRLTRMQLREKYKAEATSHRNMLRRREERAALVHPELTDLVGFLRSLGPKPARGCTVDRIDNSDPEYAPGKVRWADKRTQNSNKGDSLTFCSPGTNQVFTASQLAARQGVSPSAIRNRLRRGWTDAEIISGTRRLEASTTAVREGRRSHTACPTHGHEHRPFPKSAAQIAFERMAGAIAHDRSLDPDGYEPLPATHEELNEGLVGLVGVPEITFDSWLHRFRQIWPDYRPHMIFDRIGPDHLRAIEIIDPDYVRRERAKAANKLKIAGSL